MVTSILRNLAILGVAGALLCPSQAHGQFRPQGGFGGGGMPFGGRSGGFPGGSSGGGSMFGDPGRTFDFIAKGRPYFLVTETRSLRDPLTKFAQERGITNGQITREMFVKFSEEMKTQAPGGSRPGGGFPGGGFPGGGFPSPGGGFPAPGMIPGAMPGGGNPLDAVSQFADGEFRRRDQNGDNFLNQDEMPDSMRQDLSRWDTSRDNLIDIAEYRGYFLARFTGGGNGGGGNANPVTIILEEEFDARPTVLRAGKLPKELKWFEELDTDLDGQIGLYEWRKGGKEMGDFRSYDRNDDGLITPEEALRIMSARASEEPSGSNPFMTRGNDNRGDNNRGDGRKKDFKDFFKKRSN